MDKTSSDPQRTAEDKPLKEMKEDVKETEMAKKSSQPPPSASDVSAEKVGLRDHVPQPGTKIGGDAAAALALPAKNNRGHGTQ